MQIIKGLIVTSLFATLQKKLNAILKKHFNLNKCVYVLEKNQNLQNGYLYSNVAMLYGAKVKQTPYLFGQKIIDYLQQEVWIQKHFCQIQVTSCGYLNFYLSFFCLNKYLNYVLKQGDKVGQYQTKKKYGLIEFVSANPTGRLHIGHARNGVIGQTLSNVFRKYGWQIINEYYWNDAGNQVRLLVNSVFYRYRQIINAKQTYPAHFYQSKDIVNIAQLFFQKHQKQFYQVPCSDFNITDLVFFNFLKRFVLKKMKQVIKADLKALRIRYDRFFSETQLLQTKLIQQILTKLTPYTYWYQNALWLKTSQFGDQKDRVLIKSDQTYTYFLPDIAYHYFKASSFAKTNWLMNIWGCDHQSYGQRMQIAWKCLKMEKIQLRIFFTQMVRLVQNNLEMKMSKRAGNVVYVQDVLQFVDYAALRWNLAAHALNSQIEIDLAKLQNKNNYNQLYFVQYTYARICQVLKKAPTLKKIHLQSEHLQHKSELLLLHQLFYYPQLIETIAHCCEINKIITYVLSLAKIFNQYYEQVRFLDQKNSDNPAFYQRFFLLKVLQHTFFSAMQLLDIKLQKRV